MNKIAGIGIAVAVIAIIIVAAFSFGDDDSNTIISKVGPFTVESSQESSEEITPTGNDYHIVLTEKIGLKP